MPVFFTYAIKQVICNRKNLFTFIANLEVVLNIEKLGDVEFF